MRDATLWIRPGSAVYHDSKRCAGRHGLPTFPEIVVDAEGLSACGLCQPEEWVQCTADDCDRVFKGMNGMRQHRTLKHLVGADEGSGSDAAPKDLDRIRELEQKSRGETA